MSLAERLRAALEAGHRRTPELLIGDTADSGEMPEASTPAAVLVPIVDRAEPTVILTLRPDTMRNHAGQISFPGGRLDPEDDGPVAGALREAQEEIGLSPQAVEVIGTTDSYRTVTGYCVTPVIGVLPPDLPLTPSPGEVADLFEAPLAFLLDPARHARRSAEWRGQTRHFYEIAFGERRIWGATAAMIVNLSRRLEGRL